MIRLQGLPVRAATLAALLACMQANVSSDQVPQWQAKWEASQAAWAKHDDAEAALHHLEAAFALHPPPDAEADMLQELQPLLEGVVDDRRAVSALEFVRGTLAARHGAALPTVIALDSSLSVAKAALNDVPGALEHAALVVQAVEAELGLQEGAPIAASDRGHMSVLLGTLTSMSNLYAQYAQLDEAIDMARKAIRIAEAMPAGAQEVARLRATTASWLLETSTNQTLARQEANDLLRAAHASLRDLYDAQSPREKTLDNKILQSLRMTLENLVVCHREANASDLALRYLLERRQLPGGTQEQATEIERHLGAMLAREGDFHAARAHYKTALDLLGPSDTRRASVLVSIANIAFLQANYEEALELHTAALHLVSADATVRGKTKTKDSRKHAGADGGQKEARDSSNQVGQQWESIASCRIRLGHLGDARRALLSALRSYLSCADDQCVTQQILMLLSRLEATDEGDHDGGGGVPGRQESAALSPAQRRVGKVLLTIAMLDNKGGQLQDALTHARRARRILDEGGDALQKDRARADGLLGLLEVKLASGLPTEHKPADASSAPPSPDL